MEPIIRDNRFFGLRDVMNSIAKQLLHEFNSSAVIGHSADMGEERECFLQKFLSLGYFPQKYALSKGHGKVISTSGQVSLQTDIVLYDAFHCPILRDGERHQFFPIESVYATIQVKSRLSKTQLLDAAKNIASIKKLAENKTITRQVMGSYSGAGMFVGEANPIPLGIIFAYGLDGNSLDSLSENIREYNSAVDPKEWVNLICVLNEGMIYNSCDLQHVIDSRDIISLTQKGKQCVPRAVHHKEDALLNFYLALIGGLGKLNLTPPPLEQYIDLPIQTSTGHSYRIDGTLSCKDHGQYEAKVTERWVDKLALFLGRSPRLYKASEYLPYVANGKPDGLDMPVEIDKYAPATYVFTTDSTDPLPLLKFQREGERVKQMYMSLEVDGKKVFVPTVFIDKDYPFFEPCPLCPKGTRSAA